MAETVALTMGELDRLQVMSQLAERRLTRRRAAALLGLSERQVRRLYRAFRRDGAKALAMTAVDVLCAPAVLAAAKSAFEAEVALSVRAQRGN